MSVTNSPAGGRDGPLNEHVRAVVEDYQQQYREYCHATNPLERARYRLGMGLAQELLWEMIEEPISRLARASLGNPTVRDLSPVGPEETGGSALMSLTASLYLLLLEALPKLQIDADGNAIGYLIQVIRNKLTDDMRRHYRQTYVPGKQTRSGETMPMPRQRRFISRDAVDADIADLDADMAAERVVERLTSAQIWSVVEKWWRTSLTEDDWRIITYRMEQPARSFAAIARAFGDGYSEDLIRQRFHRIIQRTRRFLTDQQLW